MNGENERNRKIEKIFQPKVLKRHNNSNHKELQHFAKIEQPYQTKRLIYYQPSGKKSMKRQTPRLKKERRDRGSFKKERETRESSTQTHSPELVIVD